MAEINVTPLVDVMLVLLIIFMITTPLMNHKVKVQLPEAVVEKKDDKKQADPAGHHRGDRTRASSSGTTSRRPAS